MHKFNNCKLKAVSNNQTAGWQGSCCYPSRSHGLQSRNLILQEFYSFSFKRRRNTLL